MDVAAGDAEQRSPRRHRHRRRPRRARAGHARRPRRRSLRRRGGLRSAPSTTCPGWLYPLVWPFQQLGALVLGPVGRTRRPAPAQVPPGHRRVHRHVAQAGQRAGASRQRSAASARARRSARTSSCAATSTSRGESFVSGHAVLVAALAGVVTPYLPGRWKVVPVGPRRRGHVRARVRRRPQPARRRLRRGARHRHRRGRQPGDRRTGATGPATGTAPRPCGDGRAAQYRRRRALHVSAPVAVVVALVTLPACAEQRRRRATRRRSTTTRSPSARSTSPRASWSPRSTARRSRRPGSRSSGRSSRSTRVRRPGARRRARRAAARVRRHGRRVPQPRDGRTDRRRRRHPRRARPGDRRPAARRPGGGAGAGRQHVRRDRRRRRRVSTSPRSATSPTSPGELIVRRAAGVPGASDSAWRDWPTSTAPHFGEFVALDAGGPAHAPGARRRATSTSPCCSRTDPAIGELDLVELADDRGLQPAENITPLVRAEVVDRWGDGVVAVIDAASARADDRGRARAQRRRRRSRTPTSGRSSRRGGRRCRRDDRCTVAGTTPPSRRGSGDAELARPADGAPDPPPAPPVGRPAAAAAQHRPHRPGVDRRPRRARGLAGRRPAVAVGPPGHRPGRRRRAAGHRRAAHRLADDDRPRRRPGGDGLDAVRRQRRSCSSRPIVFKRWRHLFTFLGSVVVAAGRRRRC